MARPTQSYARRGGVRVEPQTSHVLPGYAIQCPTREKPNDFEYVIRKSLRINMLSNLLPEACLCGVPDR